MARSIICDCENRTAAAAQHSSVSNEIRQPPRKLENSDRTGERTGAAAVTAAILIGVKKSGGGDGGSDASNNGSRHVRSEEDCGENTVTRLARKFSSICLKEEQKGTRRRQQHSGGGDGACSERNSRQATAALFAASITAAAEASSACRVRNTIRLFEVESNRVKTKTLHVDNGDDCLILAPRNRSKLSLKDEQNVCEKKAPTPASLSSSSPPQPAAHPKVAVTTSNEPSSHTLDQLTETRRSVNGQRRCVSMLAKHAQAYASYDVKTLKNRPLSVARAFHLESVLNNGRSSALPTPAAAESTMKKQRDITAVVSLSSTGTLNKNCSFLHRSINNLSRSSFDQRVQPPFVSPQNSRCSAADARHYDDIADVHDDSYGYSNIDDDCCNNNKERTTTGIVDTICMEHDSGNVYDTVLYSELNITSRKGDGDNDDNECSCTNEEAAYEVVSSSMYADDSDFKSSSSSSDSCLEKANSLYETKENELNVASATTTASNTSCNSANVESDDWLDINEKENTDEISRNRMMVSKKRRIPGRLRKMKRKKYRPYHKQQQKSVNVADLKTSHSNERNKSVAASIAENFSEEICDDFDDTSSEETDNTERNFLSNVNVQSQNIYEFVKKARKKVRKSWSSFNQQMRRSSENRAVSTTVISSTNQNKVSSSTWMYSSSDEKMKINSHGLVSTRANPKASISSVHTSIMPGGGSGHWTSFKTKLRPKNSTVSETNCSSIFYVNPEDLHFSRLSHERQLLETSANIKRKKLAHKQSKTTYLDVNLSRPRPSSPPPPPPIVTATIAADKPVENTDIVSSCKGSNNHNVKDHNSDFQNSINTGTGANYLMDSPLSSSNSDFNSSCSDLGSRFANEPLYQFYAETVAQVSRLITDDVLVVGQYLNNSLSDDYEEIGSCTSRPSAMELITPPSKGHGQYRSLWCEVDEVKNSGMLEKLSINRQKLQEAKFEVITSEASYYKSLTVLDRIFVNDVQLLNEKLICKSDWQILFGNVAAVRKCSQLVLSDLENCWQDDIMLTRLGDVILEHASTYFKLFVKYCSNQIYIDRTLKKLREENSTFVEIIAKLEADPVCHSLSLHSFLMLPMQRITRMPLLVDAIISKLELINNDDDVEDCPELVTFKTTLVRLNKIVKECNENTRKFERYEEMLLLSRQLEFSRKEVKMFSVASSSRWLVRSGPLLHLNPSDVKLTITRKLTKNKTKLYFFLFNDILVIAKKKSEDNYSVLDYCLRNVMQMKAVEDTYQLPVSSPSSPLSLPYGVNLYSPHQYLLVLTILENHEGKMVEMVLSCDSDSTRQRWLEASYSCLTSDNPNEKLYEEWDCPQVLAVHVYVANQPDELSLQNGDIVKVLKKTTDGWYHGERIRDGMVGWFPGNYTVEVASQHTRAKNLKLRHRLLALSADYLQNLTIQKH